MNIVACDPGLAGAAAVLNENGDLVTCFDLPVIADDGQRRIDTGAFANLIRAYPAISAAIVEHAAILPGVGVSRMFKAGQNHGVIIGVIGALAIPVRHVSPAKWKRALGLNSDGEMSRARAIETWPARAELLPVSAITTAVRRPCSGCMA